MKTVAGHACKAVHPNHKLLAQAVQLFAGLGPGPIIATPYLHFAQLQSKSTSEKKTWEKIVSVMESVSLI